MKVVCDIETDSLNPTLIWCIVAQDIETGEWYEFWRPDIDAAERSRFVDFAARVDLWIGHNWLSFDYPTLVVFGLLEVGLQCILDTLVVSRVLNYPIDGGHSLESWGNRLKLSKPHIDNFATVNKEEILHRCREDVKINTALYNWFRKWIDSPSWQSAIAAEHKIAVLCDKLEHNGFYFNKEDADVLYEELCVLEAGLLRELQSAFPPTKVLVREYIPRLNLDGTIARNSVPKGTTDFTCFTPGVPFPVYRYEEFNPGSPKQVVERLNEAGWSPTAKTKGHVEADKSKDTPKERLEEYRRTGWKVNEENLETLSEDAPAAAHKLVQWLLINNRKSRLEEWFNAYNVATHRIHGKFLGIGAWTHRMAHQAPNMGNVPSVDSKYNGKELKDLAKKFGIRLRSLWTVPSGRALIGVDADSIQLRVLAHYMNDTAFTEALLTGDKDKGTDAHTLNALKLGFDKSYRAKAKTFIYAFLLGAGVAKVATILGISIPEAKERVELFIKSYPGLYELKREIIPRDAKRGYFVGFDGRLVPCNSEHLMLAGYLQNGESCVMKHSTIAWSEQADAERLDYLLVNYVHDEWDTEVEPEQADYLANMQCVSIKTTGEKFGLNCPMAGSIKKGFNWYDVH